MMETYVTSVMYMEFINSFKKLTIKKWKEILMNKQRYVGGLAKLNEASRQESVFIWIHSHICLNYGEYKKYVLVKIF